MISMKAVKRTACTTVVLIMLTGCTLPHMLASSTTPVEGRPYQETGETWGKACIKTILFVPFLFDASLKTALKNARDKVNADALIGVVVDSEQIWALFYNQVCTTVHGTGIRFTGQKAPFLEPGPAAPSLPAGSSRTAAAEKEDVAPTVAAAKAATERVAEAKEENEPQKREKRTRKRRVAKKEKKARESKNVDKTRGKDEPASAGNKKREKKKRSEDGKSDDDAKKLQKEKEMALAKRKAEEESRPVPEQFKIFCKYKKGSPVKVETKAAVIEGQFLRCVYFGVRIKKKDGQEGVIPFEDIWTVKKALPVQPGKENKPDESSAGKRGPAEPRKPARPAKPAIP